MFWGFISGALSVFGTWVGKMILVNLNNFYYNNSYVFAGEEISIAEIIANATNFKRLMTTRTERHLATTLSRIINSNKDRNKIN